MVNITHKSTTLRKATATALVVLSSETAMNAVKEKRVPKGDVFEFARVAALFAIKKTSEVIPDCHPLPIEYSDISFTVNELTIQVTVEVHTVYKTGVEVEAMHGASIAALTLYDMLKPLDKHIEIQLVKLLHKEGGKTNYQIKPGHSVNAAVIVCSDSVYNKQAIDKAGLAVVERLKNLSIETRHYEVIPDEAGCIRKQMEVHAGSGIELLFFVGGTGVSPRDITPDVVKPLLEKELHGVMEEARRYGQERMAYAMLSRGVAGFVKKTLVLTLPGSSGGAVEYIDALFPQVLHVFDVIAGHRHER